MKNTSNPILSRLLLHGFQLFCLLFVLTGLTNLNPLIIAIDSYAKGAVSLPDLCWKILPVTGPLIPSICCIALVQWCIRKLRAPTHAPHEPWMANPMWANKHIRLSNRGVFGGIGICLLFYAGIMVPLAIATEKTAIQVFIGIFGLVLLVAANGFWRNRVWNRSELRMAMVPGVIGGPFSGVVILKDSFPTGTVFSVSLKCLKISSHRNSNGGSGSSSKTDTIWSTSLTIDKTLPSEGPHRTLVPFSFAIPFDCESTCEWNTDSYSSIHWNLVVNKKGKDGFGGAVFKVPIYRTSESRRDYELDTELITPFEQQVDDSALLARLGMSMQKFPGDIKRITFSVRNTKVVFAIGVMLLFCAGCIFAAFWFLSNRYASAFLSIFPGIMFLAGVYTLIDMLLWKSSIDIDKDFVRCQSGWKGFERTLTVDKKEGVAFLCEFDSNKQNGEWYRVDAYLPSRQKGAEFHEAETLIIVRQLDGPAEAQAIQSWLLKQTGLSAPTPPEVS